MTQTTDTLSQLVRAVRADPGDRAARQALADCLEENGQEERAEYLKRGVEWEELKGISQPNDAAGLTETRRVLGVVARLAELRAALAPAWPCPRCNNHEDIPWTSLEREAYATCDVCGGSGDLLRGDRGARYSTYGHTEILHAALDITYDPAYYPLAVTVPELAGVVEEVTVHPGFVDIRPTPRLTALRTPTPWGVPLAGVIPGDREPARAIPHPKGWHGDSFYWEESDAADEGRFLPAPVFDRLERFSVQTRRDGLRNDGTGNRQRHYPTPDAARLALGVAVYQFGG